MKAGDGQWAIIWAAGAATVAGSQAQADAELATFRAFVGAVAARPPAGHGRFLLASSAGGVYAGATNPPFSAATAPEPLGVYGCLKLAQEDAATHALSDICPVVVARIANLYGPGQNLAKLQGLVSRLAWCAATQEPANIFVPLDTIRDYVYVDDAARTCLRVLERATHPSEIAVIASGRPVTVGQLIRTVQQVTKRHIPVALGSHTSARDQVLDLRLEPSIEIAQQTPLPVGVKSTFLDILSRRQGGSTA
jgi:UDP-glucose 4-epimerase